MSDSIADGFFAGKRFLVCGPGYVGGAVVSALIGEGATVAVLTRSMERLQRFAARGVSGWSADIAEDSWHQVVAGPYDGVLYAVSSGGGGVEGYRRSYEAGLRSLLGWARDQGKPPHLIYTGSTSVYSADGGVEVDESAPADAHDERSSILRVTEDLVRQWPSAWTILRLAGIYGPQRHYLLDQLRAGAREVAGRGDFHLNLVHRDDIVQAVLHAWAQPKSAADEVFNAVDDGRFTKAEVVTYLADRLGMAPPTFTGVSAPGRRARLPDRVVLNRKLRTVLGWSPRFPSYREGYAALLEA